MESPIVAGDVPRLEHELALAREHLAAVDAAGARGEILDAIAAVKNAKDALQIAQGVARSRAAALADIHVVPRAFRRHRPL